MRSWILVALCLAACGHDDVDRFVGARCDKVADCEDRCLGPSAEFPDGFCSVDCSNNNDCPANAACVDREGSVCLFQCVNNSDCDFLGPGWSCRDDNLHESPEVKVGVCRGD